MGKTDQRLRTKRSVNKRVTKDESDWVVIQNHHEAIVTPTQFDRVQDILNSRKKPPTSITAPSKKRINLFRCPYCNRKLTVNAKTISCRSGSVSLSEQCNTVKASIEQVETAITTTINQIAAYVLESIQKLMKKDKSCDIIEDGIVSLQKELKRIPGMKMQKYDLYKQGELSAEQYQTVIEEIYANKEKLEGD